MNATNFVDIMQKFNIFDATETNNEIIYKDWNNNETNNNIDLKTLKTFQQNKKNKK